MLVFLSLLDSQADKDAFEALYRAQRDAMFHAAKKVTLDDGLAEDAVQEAFFFIARNFDKIKDPLDDQTRAYVTLVTIGCARRLRREWAAEIPSDSLAEELPAGSTAEDEFFANVNRGELKAAIEDLPEVLRIPFLLRYAQGLSARQIAGMFDVSPEAMRKRLERTRRLLRQKLTADDRAEKETTV